MLMRLNVTQLLKKFFCALPWKLPARSRLHKMRTRQAGKQAGSIEGVLKCYFEVRNSMETKHLVPFHLALQKYLSGKQQIEHHFHLTQRFFSYLFNYFSFLLSLKFN